MIPKSERPYIAFGLAALIVLVGIAGLYVERRSALLAPVTKTSGATQTQETQVAALTPGNISGTITSIKGSTILVQPNIWYPAQSVRSVTTNAGTLFELRTQKSQKVLQTELQAYMNKTTSTAFVPFTQQKISPTSLHLGDHVIVSAPGNILTANQFTATEVVVLQIGTSSPLL